MVRVSSPTKLRPWSELTAKMVMGVVPGLVTFSCVLDLREESKLGGFQTGGFPTFFGKGSGCRQGRVWFGGVCRHKGQIGEIPGPSPSKSGKSQKSRESPKKDEKGRKGRTSPDWEAPLFETPLFSGP